MPWTDLDLDQPPADVFTDQDGNATLLRTDFAGSSAPASPVAYQRWADTANGVMKRRNAANNAWIIEGPLFAPARVDWIARPGTQSASGSTLVAAASCNVIVDRVTLLCALDSTASSGNEWTFVLENVTDSVELFSEAPGTFTAAAGIGGGSPITAATAFVLTPDQNTAVSAGEVLEFAWTKTGSPGALTNLSIAISAIITG